MIAVENISQRPDMAADSTDGCNTPSAYAVSRETLIKYDSVIASEAKQSMAHAKSRAYGSPRPCGTRDDGLVQCFPSGLHPSLFRCAETWCAFAIENSRAKKRVVKIGHGNAQEAEVLEGLKPGEMVIRHPANQIEECARVKTE